MRAKSKLSTKRIISWCLPWKWQSDYCISSRNNSQIDVSAAPNQRPLFCRTLRGHIVKFIRHQLKYRRIIIKKYRMTVSHASSFARASARDRKTKTKAPCAHSRGDARRNFRLAALELYGPRYRRRRRRRPLRLPTISALARGSLSI